MIFLQRYWVLSTLLLPVLSSPTLADQQQQGQQGQQAPKSADKDSFQRLLNDVDDFSLHSALHRWSSKFQDGIFSRDRTALEAVHQENAPLATSLLQVAKRQTGSNSTVPVTPSSTTRNSNPPPPSSSASAEPASSQSESPSTPPSTSDGVVQPASTRTTATQRPSTVVAPVSAPTSATPVATSDDKIVFSLSGSSGLTTVQATSEVVSFSPSSSTVLSTLTLSDGGLSTLTSVTVVDAPITGGGVGAPASSATGASNPSLQQGVASASRGVWKEVIAVVGGAVVMGLAM